MFSPTLAQINMEYDPATLVVIGFVIIQAVRWFWEMRQNQREADERVEPRHDPPIHKEYVPRKEFDEHKKQCPTLAGGFATKPEVLAVHKEVEDLKNHVDGEFRDLRKASADSRGKMYESIRKVEQDVAELRKSDDVQTDALKEIGTDIKGLISQVSNLKGKVEKI